MKNQYNDLRQWLEQVEAIGELAHPKGADWNLEIGGVSEIDYKKRGPALLFENPTGFDMPVLGNLFKSKSKTNNRDELLIFVTPKILREGAEIY